MITHTTRLILAALLCLLLWSPRSRAEDGLSPAVRMPPAEGGAEEAGTRRDGRRDNGPARSAERKHPPETRQANHEELFRLDGKDGGKDLFRLDGGSRGHDDLFRLDGGSRQERRESGNRDTRRDDGRSRPHEGPRRDDHRDAHDRPEAFRGDRDSGRGGDRDIRDVRRRDDRHRDVRSHGGPHPSSVRYSPLGEQRRPDDGRHDDRRYRVHHEVRHVVHHLPPRHAVILHGRERYHYHGGRFYRPWTGGFILVRPPLGLIVLSLPIGSRMVVSAGITYHVFGDVYYRRVPAGYEVVEPMRAPGRAWPAQVEVLTDRLNLRYGPDENEEIIAQAGRFTILNVIGSAPGWLYVEIDGEDVRGWVMERYVTTDLGRG